MSSIQAEIAFVAECSLGEGSLWDIEHQLLYWVDIVGQKVFAFDPVRGTNHEHHVGQDVGTVVLTRDGQLLVAVRNGFAVLDPASGRLEPWVDPEADRPGNRFNDGKCDPRGRLWAGTMVEDGQMGNGALYCLETDRSVTRKLDGVSCSNGLVWSGDERTFFYIDTPTRRVDAFDFRLDDGTLSNRRTVTTIPEEWGAPDGMAIDEQDHLWIALWGGGKVVRLNPASGQVVFEVEVPASQVTSCAFGGPELNDLYVTTARIGLNSRRLATEPQAGSLFRVRVPVRGVPSMRFGAQS